MILTGMATIEGRQDYCTLAVKSLVDQVDCIHLVKGEYGKGYTDNGKFKVLDYVDEPCYIFLCDDDILYPHDYAQKTIEAINKHNCIVTYHGRKLRGEGRNYYRGHETFRCLGDVDTDKKIDVCGTGVTAFHTSYFFPKGLHEAKDKMMSDLVFSLEAAKQGKKIMVIEHSEGWLKDLDPPSETSIHANHWNNCKRQNEIADEIWRIKNKS
jgi:hypothetical protein